MKIHKRKFGSIALALVTSVSMALGGLRTYAEAPARGNNATLTAAKGTGVGDEASLELSKVLKANDGMHLLNNETFTFNFTPYSFDGSTSEASIRKMPSISVSGLIFTDTQLQAATVTEGVRATAPESHKANLQINGHDMKGSDFPNAGIYTYAVTENDPSETIQKDSSKQWLKIYVANTKANNGEVEAVTLGDKTKQFISAIVVQKDEAGTSVTPTGDKQESLTFTNVIKPKDGSVTIKKKLKDNHLDATDGSKENHNNEQKEFVFQIKFIKKGDAKEESKITVPMDVINKDENDASVTKNTKLHYNTKYEFKLRDNEELKFSNIPIGTNYELTEINEGSEYTPSVKATQADVQVKYGNEPSTTTLQGEKGKNLEAHKTANVDKAYANKLIIAETDTGDGTKNSVTFTNTYDFLVLTGIIMNNLPFVLMIGVATLGIAGYVIAKRRRYNH